VDCYGIVFEGYVDIRFIIALYEHDRKSEKKLCPKLTFKMHVNPKGWALMKVAPAMQVFSNTAAK
jgi:hypothetical protein